MILSEVQQRTDDVTSAGVNSLGIMSVTDRSGATPDADNLLAIKIIRTHRGAGSRSFVFDDRYEQNKPTASERQPPKKTPGTPKSYGMPLWNMPGQAWADTL